MLAETLLLCVSGIVLGLLIAKPIVSVLARYAARYSVRALDLGLDWSALWVAAALALVAAVLLAFVPRLPSPHTHAAGFTGSSSPGRTTGTANRKLTIFALVQVAACFLLVVAAAAAGHTLLWMQSARLGFNMRHVLAVNIPAIRNGRTPAQLVQQDEELVRRVRQLPDVVNAAVSTSVPWRDRREILEFSVDSQPPPAGHSAPRADWQIVSPGFFATLGLTVTAGRDFREEDRASSEPVAIVSETLATKLFPNGDALNHHVSWTDPMLRSGVGMASGERRIVGIVPDVDNDHVRPAPAMTIYEPVAQDQTLLAQRLVVETRAAPYAAVAPIRRVVHDLSADQPVEHASTLEDIRADVLAPERLNALISGGFAAIALLIAIVGVGGVLAFSVSGRTREFGIRLAMGSQPRWLLARVMAEGAAIVSAGLLVGLACGFALTRVAATYVGDLAPAGTAPLVASALLLLVCAMAASALPAIRAARVDVVRALRAE